MTSSDRGNSARPGRPERMRTWSAKVPGRSLRPPAALTRAGRVGSQSPGPSNPVRPLGHLLLALCVLASVAGVATAFGDEQQSPGYAPLPTAQEVGEAIEGEGSQSIEPTLTDPGAAEGVAKQDLGRGEALELLQGVFEPELQSPAGIFDDLHVEKFLADNVAVIAAGEQPESPTEEDSGQAGYQGATLMQSTVPLRTEGPSGNEETVDLGLRHTEGELQPANPLVEVGIPQELGEGIELPESGVTIELAGAPEDLSPSTVDQSVGFYPNVATDTDLAVAPAPTGVETLTQMRSADSPRSQTFELGLPDGASLEAEGGGAKVTREGETILGVAPPTAIDATGGEVPVSLAVSGSSLTLIVSPAPSTRYPILVDPLFQTYEWYAKGTTEGIHFYVTEGWTHWGDSGPEKTHPLGGLPDFENTAGSTIFEPTVKYGSHGLYLANLTNALAGGEAFWRYTVPRYYSDPYAREGNEPESFISKMTVTNMDWKAESEALSPYVYMGLWGPTTGWSSGLYSHEGLKGHSVNNMTWVYTFENPLGAPDVQAAQIGLYSSENVPNKAWAYLFAGAATVELGEPSKVVPKIGEMNEPAQWLNQTPTPLTGFTASDAGLGVYALTISGEQGASPPSWRATYGCTGVPGNPCPYIWKSSSGSPGPKIDPSVLPTGTNTLKVVAEDPIGRVSTPAHIEVRVDHTAPVSRSPALLPNRPCLGPRGRAMG